MDVLSDVLENVRLRSDVFGRLEMSAPWAVELAMGHEAYLHAVIRGRCFIDVDDTSIELVAGDWIFVLGGNPHVVRSDADAIVCALPEVYEQHGAECGGVLHHGGGGAVTTLISSSYLTSGPWLRRVLANLPSAVHVRSGQDPASTSMHAAISVLAAEMEGARPGHQIVAARLSDALFVQALRTLSPDARWLSALLDDRLGHTLRRLHKDPAHPWTVKEMAIDANMSRSTFAPRFKQAVGSSPLTYLTVWRLQLACRLLDTTNATLAAIARQVGYRSDAALSKAFRRHIGMPPGAYRAASEPMD